MVSIIHTVSCVALINLIVTNSESLVLLLRRGAHDSGAFQNKRENLNYKRAHKTTKKTYALITSIVSSSIGSHKSLFESQNNCDLPGGRASTYPAVHTFLRASCPLPSSGIGNPCPRAGLIRLRY